MASTTGTPAAPSELAKQTSCPRCGKPLTDAAGLGWCAACGYCHSLEDDASKRLLPVEPAKPTKAAVAAQQAGQAVSNIPVWCYALLAGVLGIAAMSVWQGRRLPPDGLPRALWTTLQLGLGLLCFFFGQFIALVRVAPDDPQLTFKDMFLPFRLWSQAFKRARKLAPAFLLSGWGFALGLCACLFIGGLGHWMTYMPGGKNSTAKKVTF